MLRYLYSSPYHKANLLVLIASNVSQAVYFTLRSVKVLNGAVAPVFTQ